MEKVIFKNLTNVKFQQLKNVVTKDKLRPQLSGVFLDLEHEKLVVTNGHSLIAYDIEIVLDSDDVILQDIVIDPKIFNQQTWLSVPKEDAELVEFHVTEAKTEIFLGEEMVAVANNIPHEQKFPNWFGVLNNEDFRHEVGIDAKLVKQTLSALPDGFGLPKLEIGKKITFKSVDVHEDFGEIAVVGVIMPLNFGEYAIYNKSEAVDVSDEIIGRTTSQRVINSWIEKFVDEDTGESVDIERNEIVLERETEIGQDEIALLLSNGIQKIFVHKI